MTSDRNSQTVTWKKSPSIKKLDKPTTPSNWSDATSHTSSHIASSVQASSAESSPRSHLEIRARLVTPLEHLSNQQRPQLTTSHSLPIPETQPLVSSTVSSLSRTQISGPIASKKRHRSQYIDLTSDDDDFESPELIQRKKSRSSSHSTEASLEARSNISKIVNKPSLKSVLQNENLGSQEKNPRPRSPNPGNPFRSAIPAVLVPPPQPSPVECRRIFIKNLSVLKDVSVVNTVDNTSPPLDFQFIAENVLRADVHQVSEEFMIGCKCRKDNGRHMGCEYLSCECLDDLVDSEGKKAFPYSQGKLNTACLRDQFLKGRNHIYECNSLCNCERNCKNRVVQHGRNVGLEIFKTNNRGWGLRCTQYLKKGQFIDTYRGEIITHEEANRRGETRTLDQEIYLMGLDKWTEEDGGSKYVCDGMHLGGPTRFINHSCDPNCAIYTVSYNHADINIYDLAFFATEPIPAGTELTFNYVDDDRTDIITEEKADEMQQENGYRPAKCLCGSSRCRGYFFT